MTEGGWLPTAWKSERLPYHTDPQAWAWLAAQHRLLLICLPLAWLVMSVLFVCFKSRHFLLLLFLCSLNNAIVCHTSSMIKTDKLLPLWSLSLAYHFCWFLSLFWQRFCIKFSHAVVSNCDLTMRYLIFVWTFLFQSFKTMAKFFHKLVREFFWYFPLVNVEFEVISGLHSKMCLKKKKSRVGSPLILQATGPFV